MTAEQAVYERLLATAAVRALVVDRVYPMGEVPQTPTYPYVEYQRISGTDSITTEGLTGLERVRVQLDAYWSSYPQIAAMHEAIKATLHGQTWAASDASEVLLVLLDNSRDLPVDQQTNPAPAVKVKCRSADYFVHFRKKAGT